MFLSVLFSKDKQWDFQVCKQEGKYNNIDLRIVENKSTGCQIGNDSKYGHNSDGQNFYPKFHHEFQKITQIPFLHL